MERVIQQNGVEGNIPVIGHEQVRPGGIERLQPGPAEAVRTASKHMGHDPFEARLEVIDGLKVTGALEQHSAQEGTEHRKQPRRCPGRSKTQHGVEEPGIAPEAGQNARELLVAVGADGFKGRVRAQGRVFAAKNASVRNPGAKP